MKKTLTLFVIAGFFLSVLSMNAYAFMGKKSQSGKMCPMWKEGRGGSGDGMERPCCPVSAKIMKKAHFFSRHAADLGLTDEQVKAIKDIKVASEKAQIQAASNGKIFELDLKQKLSEDKLDVEGIQAMIDVHTAAMAKTMKDGVAEYAKLKGVLSDDQLSKAKTLWSQQKKEWEKVEKD